MRIKKFAAAALLGAAVIGLSGCETGFPAQVSRFQAMPAPAGQTFFVVPMDTRLNGSLEFQRYGAYVAQALQAQGYAPATTPAAASLIVNVGYNVDRGTTEYQSDPFGRGGYGFGMGYGGMFARPYYYPRFGYRSAFYYGWDDPFYSPFDTGITSYRVYRSKLDVDIRRHADNQSVFEGHAKARSENDDLSRIVPNLVEAMFTGFPGRNGETVMITVPSAARAARRY
jgi:hypothetical protein